MLRHLIKSYMLLWGLAEVDTDPAFYAYPARVLLEQMLHLSSSQQVSNFPVTNYSHPSEPILNTILNLAA